MAAPSIGAALLSAADATSGAFCHGVFLAGVPIGGQVSIVFGWSGATGVTLNSLTDSRGNTYVVRTQKGTGGATGCYTGIADCLSVTTAILASDVIDGNLSSAVTHHAILGFQWTGIAGYDASAAGGTATSTAPNSGAATVSNPNSVLIGACYYGATTGRTPDSGQAQQAAVNGTSHQLTYNTQPANTPGSYTDSGVIASALWTDSASAYFGTVDSRPRIVIPRTAVMTAGAR